MFLLSAVINITMAMQIPTPEQLGLNPKFKEWRMNQAQAIDDALSSDKRFIGQVLSLGEGKSLSYVAVALISKARTMILTSTKGLQSQLLSDFEDIGLVDIRGKSNYSCGGIPGKTCEDGTIGKCMFRGTSSCSWHSAKATAGESSLVTTNYPCWASTNRYGQGFGSFDLVVMDEAHAAEDALCRALKITLSRNEIRDLLKFSWPSEVQDMAEWKSWASIAKRRTDIELQDLKTKLDSAAHPSDTMIRNFRQMSNLKRKLADVALCKPDDWVVENWAMYDGFQFDPIHAANYAEKVLFWKAPKVILTSGTIRPRNLQALGIPEDDFDFFEYPREVNPSRTPLMFIPTVSVDRNTPEWGLRKLVERVDEIIESRADRRGIIHTGNFKIRDFIVQNSRFSQYMISNYTSEGDVTAEIIKRFKTSHTPAVLVTPSVTTGYDFPGSTCRYQIIAKLPYPNLHESKVEQERSKLDPKRGIAIMWQHLAQAFGRPDRGPDDWAETFVIDNNIENAMWKHAKLAPPWLPAFFSKRLEVPVPTRFD